MEIPDQPKPDTHARRDILKGFGAIALGTTGLVDSSQAIREVAALTENTDPRMIPQETGLETKEWDASLFELTVANAIQESIDTNSHIEVTLPSGNITIDRNLKFDTRNASIKLKGNNTQLSLASELSDIPKDWASEGHNMLEFDNVTGSIGFEGIRFDGGSQRAGKGGYVAPGGPWDAIVAVNGAGPGSDKDIPPEYQNSIRTAKATITNCQFENSEAPGFLGKNLNTVAMSDSQGENLDALLVAAWCDTVKTDHLEAANCLSEGIGVYACQGGEINNTKVRTARQGILIHGSNMIKVANSEVEDVAIGYLLDKAGVNKQPNQNLTFTNANSTGAAMAYAVASTYNSTFNDSTHENLGEWFVKDADGNGDFLHSGIEAHENIDAPRQPIWIGQDADTVTFSDITMKKGPGEHAYAKPMQIKGITTEGF